MTHNIFSKTGNLISRFFLLVLSIPSMLGQQYQAAKDSIQDLKYNLGNLAESNMKLGIYHLNNQNYNDAIFRFTMVDKFFRPNDALANYWLGWAYFLKGNYKKAITCLAKGTDKDGLLELIRGMGGLRLVPDNIYMVHRGITAAGAVARFFDNKGNDLTKELIIQLTRVVEIPPEGGAILEIGSNIGLVGAEIKKRIRGEIALTGVEISPEMMRLQKVCGNEERYNKIINMPAERYLQQAISEKKKYDIVISSGGFSNNSDLNNFFSKIFGTLTTVGHLAFVVPVSNSLVFLEKQLEFSYSKDYITELLTHNGFKIMVNSDFQLEMKNNYSIFICKKPG